MRRRQMYAQQSESKMVAALTDPCVVYKTEIGGIAATVYSSDEGLTLVTNNKDACPKCGRIVKQGKVLHQKYCRGK